MRHFSSLLIVMLCGLVPTWGAPAARVVFKIGFDDLTSNASIAKGDGQSDLGRGLGATAKEGVKGVGLRLDDEETCTFASKDNLPGIAGTVSVWVKPLNWDDTENRFQEFFIASGAAGGKSYYMTLDSPPIKGAANFGISIHDRATGERTNYIASGAVSWTDGKWVNLVGVWDKQGTKLYINGLLSAAKLFRGDAFASLPEGRFKLIPHNHFRDGPQRSRRDRTTIDEVTIWDGALPADEVLGQYTAVVGGSTRINRVPVPRATGKITVDGRLDEIAWAKASEVPILTEMFSVYPFRRTATASLCYGAEHLYIAFQSPFAGQLQSRHTKHDDPLWEDDSFEIYLAPDRSRPEAFYQWVINASDAVYDSSSAGRKEWDSRIRARSAIDKGIWTLEVAVPFSDFGATKPKPGDVWLGNLCRNWYRKKPLRSDYTEWCYVGGGYSANPDRFGRLVFAGDEDGVRLRMGADISLGELAFGLATQRPRSGQVIFSVRDRQILRDPVKPVGNVSWRSGFEDYKDGLLSIALENAGGDEPVFIYETKVLHKDLIGVTYLPFPAEKRLGLKLDLSALDREWKNRLKEGNGRVEVTLTDPGGKAHEEGFPVRGEEQTVHVPCEFKEGEYTLVYRLSQPDREGEVRVTGKLMIPPLPWVGNRIGVTNEVLSPWSPLAYSGKGVIGCWNRSYTFDGPFLSQAANGGNPILRAPIRLSALIDGTDHPLTTTSTQSDMQRPDRAETSGKAVFQGTPLKVAWSNWMEYDGLTVATVALEPPPEGLTIDRLSLTMPLRPDIVKYLRGTRHMGALRNGRLPWDGKVWRRGFEPYLWVSNEYEGFLYFCESEANWVHPDGAQDLLVVKGGEDAGIALNLISKPTRLTQPFSYTFGFQATPVKPLSKALHKWNFGSYNHTKHQTAQPWFTVHAPQEGRWGVRNGKKLLAHDRKCREQGITQFYYSVASSTPENNSTFDLYRGIWLNPYSLTFGPYSFRPHWKGWREPEPPYFLPGVDPASPSFQNLRLYNARTMLRDYGVRGLYSDMDGVYATDNLHAGGGYRDGFGKSGPSYGILGKRRVAKRLAALLRTVGGERRYWLTHEHNKLVPPVHAWADFWWPGEELTNDLYKKKWFYMEDLDDVAWRVEYSSTASGLEHVFLPEFGRGTKDPDDLTQAQPSESLLAMCAVNDVNCSGSYMNAQAMETFWALRDELGIADCPRKLYWEGDCPAKALTASALASVYLSERGPVLAIVNRQPEETVVELKLDLTGLGLAPGRALVAHDARRAVQIPLKGTVLHVPVAARNYTFVSIRPEGDRAGSGR
ncbi:MAG: hypothetical protein HN380_21260 [Victivallales bacterium]|jgi:hypothetical protein|nr:hypothetical protein [Victivallales bacterium]